MERRGKDLLQRGGGGKREGGKDGKGGRGLPYHFSGASAAYVSIINQFSHCQMICWTQPGSDALSDYCFKSLPIISRAETVPGACSIQQLGENGNYLH